MILSCSHISKAFPTGVVLDDISFHIEDYEKAAIVGINGAGKTTLLRIIVGEMEPDLGQAVLAKGRTLGYLAQHQDLTSHRSIYDELLEVKRPVIELEERIRSLEQQMKHVTGDELDQMLETYTRLTHEFELAEGYSYRSEIVGVLKGLGFTEEDFPREISTLSGGQKTRVSLGKLLLSRPDIILLDEPTNHLDMSSIAWLENYLLNYKGAVIIVAHDRYFLDKIATKIIELENGHSSVYPGNYTAYSQKKALVREAQMKAYLNQQQEIRHQEEVIRKLRSFNREKSIKRAESREKMLSRIDVLDKPAEINDEMNLRLEPDTVSGEDVLTIRNLSKAFGSNRLFSHVDIDIRRGERVAIIGDNGTGKTTLLKIINQLLPADAGEITLGSRVSIAYYDQDYQVLHMEKTLFDELQDAYPEMNNTKVRSILAAFLFTGDDVFKRIGDLSGGERGRVSLAKLMLAPANFLILDEPTNHLDITSKEILEDALNHYTGTVLYVSHDRYFINRTATRILELAGEQFINYIGNYDYYLEKRDLMAQLYLGGNGSNAGNGSSDRPGQTAFSHNPSGQSVTSASSPEQISRKRISREQTAAAATAYNATPWAAVSSSSSSSSAGSDTSSRQSWQAKKEEQARQRKRQNDLKKTEDAIASLEERDSQLDELLSQPEVATDVARLLEINKEKEEIKTQLETLYKNWETLAEDA